MYFKFVARRWDYTELEDSIKRIGVYQAVLKWRGVVHDGRRRVEIAERLGVPYSTVEPSSESDFAKAYFRLEPERAFAHWAPVTLRDCAELFGLSLGDAARLFEQHGERKQQPLKPWSTGKNVLRTFWCDPALDERVSRFCKDNGVSKSKLFRSACEVILAHPELVLNRRGRGLNLRRGAKRRLE